MACMEHECLYCDYVEFNNIGNMVCPKCGARMQSFCDESPDVFEEDETLNEE